MNKLTRARISVEALLGQIQSGERGGTCVFLGTVRNDGDVTAIDYSAYDEMAREEIGKVGGFVAYLHAAALLRPRSGRGGAHPAIARVGPACGKA